MRFGFFLYLNLFYDPVPMIEEIDWSIRIFMFLMCSQSDLFVNDMLKYEKEADWQIGKTQVSNMKTQNFMATVICCGQN